MPRASQDEEPDPVAAYRAPAEFVDSDHPEIVRVAAAVAAGASATTAAVRLFELVRDLPYQADDFEDLATYRASAVLRQGHGYCVSKASLFAALARASGLAARVAFADVRNHLASPRLLAAMGTDLFAWHGYAEVHLGGRWVKVSPTFDAATCARAGVDVLAFDGIHDALLQSFDRAGATMRYEREHGAFYDVPARFLAAEMPRRYPFVRNGGLATFVRGGG